MSPLRWLYLALSIWGAIHPVLYVGPWLIAHGFDVPALIAAWKASPESAGLYWTLMIAALSLTIWIWTEVLVRRNWRALVAIPATFVLGLGCGLPLYLFLRAKPVR